MCFLKKEEESGHNRQRSREKTQKTVDETVTIVGFSLSRPPHIYTDTCPESAHDRITFNLRFFFFSFFNFHSSEEQLAAVDFHECRLIDRTLEFNTPGPGKSTYPKKRQILQIMLREVANIWSNNVFMGLTRRQKQKCSVKNMQNARKN